MEWKIISNYLFDRQEIVIDNGTQSDPEYVTSGILQESMLGPLLFPTYLEIVDHFGHTRG